MRYWSNLYFHTASHKHLVCMYGCTTNQALYFQRRGDRKKKAGILLYLIISIKVFQFYILKLDKCKCFSLLLPERNIKTFTKETLNFHSHWCKYRRTWQLIFTLVPVKSVYLQSYECVFCVHQ